MKEGRDEGEKWKQELVAKPRLETDTQKNLRSKTQVWFYYHKGRRTGLGLESGGDYAFCVCCLELRYKRGFMLPDYAHLPRQFMLQFNDFSAMKSALHA